MSNVHIVCAYCCPVHKCTVGKTSLNVRNIINMYPSMQNWKIHVVSWCYLAWLLLNIPFMCNNNKKSWTLDNPIHMLCNCLLLCNIWIYNKSLWKKWPKTHTAMILTHLEMVLLTMYLHVLRTYLCLLSHVYAIYLNSYEVQIYYQVFLSRPPYLVSDQTNPGINFAMLTQPSKG